LIFLRMMRGYLASQKLLSSFFAGSVLVEVLYAVAAPLSLKYLVDYAFTPKDIKAFILILMLLILGGILNISAGAGGDFALAKLSGRVVRSLRIDLYTHLQKQLPDFYSRYRVGDITTRFQSDLSSIQRVIGAVLPFGLKEGITVSAGLVLLFTLEWRLALAVVLGSTLMFIGPRLLQEKAERANRAVKEAEEDFASALDETIKGHKTIIGMHLQGLLLHRARGLIQNMFMLGLRRSYVNSLLERIPMTALMLLNLIMIGFGGALILQDKLSVGEFIAFFTLFMSVGQSAFHLSFLIPNLIESSVSFQRVKELLDEHPSVAEAQKPVAMPELARHIRIDSVNFGYDGGRSILRNVSLLIPAGSFAAFVGTSGSGKSTALQLLLRFFDPQDGRITYDDVDLKEISDCSLREKVGVVFQDTFLFNATVRENLLLGTSSLSEEDMIQAAMAANIHDTIMSWPNAYGTDIVQEGASLSGGQRQRLAIARALLRKPKILLLDEVTSALDPATESEINGTVERLKGDTTVISVTHRLASIMQADLIFVFREGEIAESGSHQELLGLGGLYREMWEKQAGFSFSQDGLHVRMDLERLRKFPVFQGMAEEPLRQLAGMLTTEVYERSQSIVREGDVGDKFYMIARGSAEVRKQIAEGDHRVAVLQDGDHFGEIALLRNIPRTASVTAMERTIVLSLRREWFLELMESYPDLLEAVERTLAVRMK
jgi:ATP-binding cassette, subfamily B, bacterial